MKSTMFLAMSIGSLVFGWFTRASLDGRISAAEVTELVQQCASLYEQATGKKLEIDLE